jgi:hypothetical protein
MKERGHWNNVPVTGSFRLVSALMGKGTEVVMGQCRTRVDASSRGSAMEAFSLSVMIGLAVLGIVCGFLEDIAGAWALLAFLPVWGLVMHLLCLLCAGIGTLFCSLGLCRSSRRSVFTGISFGLAVSIFAIWQLLLGLSFTWLAFPWLAFVALECLLFPVCRMLDLAEDGQ